jgi:hypothetical protein
MIVELNLNPSARQLRQFGMISMIALPILGALWSGGSLQVAGICLTIGASLATIGWVWPQALRPVFVLLTLAFLPIGLVVGELSLLLIYFLLLAPIGLVFRVTRRDPLALRRTEKRETYWQDKESAPDVKRYFNQY